MPCSNYYRYVSYIYDFYPEKEDVKTLLLEHLDASRLARAKEIKDIEMI